MSSAGQNADKRETKKVVFDFRSNSVVESPDNMVDKKGLTLNTNAEAAKSAMRSRAMTCPEPTGRFPKPSPVGTGSANPSPRPGHYDPRIGMKARTTSDWNSRPLRSMSRDAREHCLGGVYAGTAVPTGVMKSFETCWAKKDKRLYGDRAKSITDMSDAGSRRFTNIDMSDAGMKPAVSHAQLVREAFICKTAQEMMRDFQSIVIDVKVSRGARVMWTSVPDDLKHIFNCTDIKTVDTWKQTMHGDCQLDISMFKKGDRVKMAVQSVGVSGKHSHQPLVRGVPDISKHPDTITRSTESSPRLERAGSLGSRADFGTASRARSRANTIGSPLRENSTDSCSSDDHLDEKHPRNCAKKPEPAARFRTFSQQRSKEFTHISMCTKRNRSNS